MEVIDLLTNVTIVTREFPTNSDPLEVDDLFVMSANAGVFFLNMYSTSARRILCKVDHNVTTLHLLVPVVSLDRA